MRLVVGGREHGIPHFHIKIPGGGDCAVSIATLEILAGRALPRTIQPALDWARKNKEKLLRIWQEMNPR